MIIKKIIEQQGENSKTVQVMRQFFPVIEKAESAIEADRKCWDEPVAWLYEDELPDNYPYEAMFPYSKVDGVRMFPVYVPQPAEPALEPVAWMTSDKKLLFLEDRLTKEEAAQYKCIPLYEATQPADLVQKECRKE